MPILDRLLGLETEYAIRFRPREGLADPPSRFQLYQALVARVKRHVPTAPAKHFKEGVFLANGGALWFEAERSAAGGGLIEGATPECRSPSELVLYQRAQDQLLSQTARLAELPGTLSLIKNDRDSTGQVYGAQENYEACVADGWELHCWRLALVLIFPLLLLTWLGIGLMIISMLLYLAVAGLVYLPVRLLVTDRHRWAIAFFGQDLVAGEQVGGPTAPWLELVLLWVTRLVSAPLALGVWTTTSFLAFRRIRRELTPLLVSRAVIGGAGMVDEQGDFLLADKATAINCMVGLGGFLKDRPLYAMGHFFKMLCTEAWMSPHDYAALFQPRQRLQIGLGDSNMVELGEYLRVGSTCLVLDVIEAGAMPAVPRLRRPIEALHEICRDPSLRRRVQLADGRQMTALEIQRFYWEACRDFLQTAKEVPAEAVDIVTRWGDVLDELEQLQTTGEAPAGLLGGIDWVTKKRLLDEAGQELSWATRKKIDICYHELSPVGYFQMLQVAGLAVTLTSQQAIARAVRNPPPHSPATMRGHFIREFSSEAGQLTVNWKQVVIGGRDHARTIRLDRYRRAPSSDSHATEQGAHH